MARVDSTGSTTQPRTLTKWEMNTWDVVLLRFPFNDAGGTVKMRPALVVSKNEYHEKGQDGLFILMMKVPATRCGTFGSCWITRCTSGSLGISLFIFSLSFFRTIRVDKIMNLRNDLVSRVLGSLGPTLKAAVQQKLAALWNI